MNEEKNQIDVNIDDDEVIRILPVNSDTFFVERETTKESPVVMYNNLYDRILCTMIRWFYIVRNRLRTFYGIITRDEDTLKLVRLNKMIAKRKKDKNHYVD